LHLRAILSLPIFEITLEKGSECCILASENSTNPTYSGIENIASLPKRISESLANQLQDRMNGCGFSQ
jgi:formate-dependent phosphoribosylglycinamide formyltransferase (GAR transformylase)